MTEDQNKTRRQMENKTILGAYVIALIALFILGLIFALALVWFVSR